MSYIHYKDYRDIATLTGKTLVSVNQDGVESITFTDTEGQTYRMAHNQDCCESVYIHDICGDLSDLIGSPILVAEEATSDKNPDDYKPEYQDSFLWTFYKIDTAKGGVTIRWLGESNGYYSESVDFGVISQ